MKNLQKRAGAALVLLLQNDVKGALNELQRAGDLNFKDGSPTISPVGLAFGYPCQEESRLIDIPCDGTVRPKTIGVCDQCHTQHFSAREEKRYRAEASGPQPGQEMWAIGLVAGDDTYGMIAGPWPNLQSALDFLPVDKDRQMARIIHYLPTDKVNEQQQEVTHHFDFENDEWKEI